MLRRWIKTCKRRLFLISGNLVTDYDYLPSFPSLLRKKPLFDLLEPSVMAPISAFTRDPWWYPSYAPYIPSYAAKSTPFYLRDSYLSPVKRSYLWSRHPIRPFGMYPHYFVIRDTLMKIKIILCLRK